MHRIIRSPHPLLVVVSTVHLYQHAMLGGDGVQVAIAVFCIVFLVVVEVSPCTFHLPQFRIGGKVAGFPVAAELLVVDERALLAGAQLIHHRLDIRAQLGFLLLVLAAGKRHSECRHIMAGTMTFQLGRRGVPAVGLGIAVGGKAISVAVVIKLLLHVEAQQVLDVEVAVVGQPVLAVYAHLVKRQRLSNGHRVWHRVGTTHHRHMSHHRKAGSRRVVACDITFHVVARTHRIFRGVCLRCLDRRG